MDIASGWVYFLLVSWAVCKLSKCGIDMPSGTNSCTLWVLTEAAFVALTLTSDTDKKVVHWHCAAAKFTNPFSGGNLDLWVGIPGPNDCLIFSA